MVKLHIPKNSFRGDLRLILNTLIKGQSHAVNFSDPQDTKGHMIQHGTLMPISRNTLIIMELDIYNAYTLDIT